MATDVGRLAAEGVPIERKHLRDIRHLLPTVTHAASEWPGYEIPAATLPVDVSEIARKFGGGGHRHAASRAGGIPSRVSGDTGI